MKLHRNLLRIAMVAALILAFKPSISYGIDTTQCTVYNSSDDLNEDGIYPLNSLRRLIGNFNNTSWRFCTQKIDFNPKNPNGSEIPDGEAVTIKLTQPLLIDNPDDATGLLIDGSTHAGGITIDTTEVINPETQQQDDKCAIQIAANTKKIKIQGLTIFTKQPNKLAHVGEGNNPNGNSGTAVLSLSSEEAAAVICDHDLVRNDADNDPSNDDDNDFEGVTLKNPEGMRAVCGNGQKETGEECDDGANNGATQACTSECKKNLDMDADGISDDVDNCTPELVRNHSRPAMTKAFNSDCLQGGVRVGYAGKSDCRSILDNMPNHGGRVLLLNPEDYKNPDQNNCDHDDLGDKCDNDWDNDGISDDRDNCPPVHPSDPNACDPAVLIMSANADQKNLDGDAKGDSCDDDIDNDGVPNAADQCPSTLNPNQIDEDHDGCDDPVQNLDSDGDGVPDSADNCPIPNAGPLQLDSDGDGQGDVCDSDDDNDGMSDVDELAGCQTPTPLTPLDPLKPDSDGDGFLDGVDPCPCGGVGPTSDIAGCDGGPLPLLDTDNDGVPNISDNCPETPNPDQVNNCDPNDPNADTDGDGVVNGTDNCPAVRNADQMNRDGDNEGDACDANPDVNDNPPPAQSACSLSTISNSGSIAGSLFWGVALLLLLGLRRFKRS